MTELLAKVRYAGPLAFSHLIQTARGLFLPRTPLLPESDEIGGKILTLLFAELRRTLFEVEKRGRSHAPNRSPKPTSVKGAFLCKLSNLKPDPFSPIQSCPSGSSCLRPCLNPEYEYHMPLEGYYRMDSESGRELRCDGSYWLLESVRVLREDLWTSRSQSGLSRKRGKIGNRRDQSVN